MSTHVDGTTFMILPLLTSLGLSTAAFVLGAIAGGQRVSHKFNVYLPPFIVIHHVFLLMRITLKDRTKKPSTSNEERLGRIRAASLHILVLMYLVGGTLSSLDFSHRWTDRPARDGAVLGQAIVMFLGAIVLAYILVKSYIVRRHGRIQLTENASEPVDILDEPNAPGQQAIAESKSLYDYLDKSIPFPPALMMASFEVSVAVNILARLNDGIASQNFNLISSFITLGHHLFIALVYINRTLADAETDAEPLFRVFASMRDTTAQVFYILVLLVNTGITLAGSILIFNANFEYSKGIPILSYSAPMAFTLHSRIMPECTLQGVEVILLLGLLVPVLRDWVKVRHQGKVGYTAVTGSEPGVGTSDN